MFGFVAYGQFFTSFGTAGSQNTASVGSFHSFTESMLVFPLTVRGLECPFHILIVFCIRDGKSSIFL